MPDCDKLPPGGEPYAKIQNKGFLGVAITGGLREEVTPWAGVSVLRAGTPDTTGGICEQELIVG